MSTDLIFVGDTVLDLQAPGYGVYGRVITSTAGGYVLEPISNKLDVRARRWVAPFDRVRSMAQVRASWKAEA